MNSFSIFIGIGSVLIMSTRTSRPKHKTKATYGPLLKWVPQAVLKALRMYAELPLRANPYFWVPHTPTEQVTVDCVLRKGCTTLGYPGAADSTNFVRKVFHTMISCGGVKSKKERDELMKDLADLDAHSYSMANSAHYDISNFTRTEIVRKSINIYQAAMGRNPPVFGVERF